MPALTSTQAAATGTAAHGAAPLVLYPGGYPLHIDVPAASIGGAGTAMRFTLPRHAHNFPLLHSREHKLVVALAGQLRLRAGGQTIAQLATGQAVLVPPLTVHRIAQDGVAPAMVGVVLWPGAVEQAFRDMAALAADGRFQRSAVIALLARYGVRWTAAPDSGVATPSLAPRDFCDLAYALPPLLQVAVARAWCGYLAPFADQPGS